MLYKFIKDNFASLVIVVLFGVILLQRCGHGRVEPVKPTIDTVFVYTQVHDTIQGKPRFVKSKRDTLWIDSIIYKPDTIYTVLLDQYLDLGNKHFATNIFKTDVSIGKFGNGKIIDTIRQNKLIGSGFEYDILVPEKTVTVTQPEEPRREVYLGIGSYGNKQKIVDGVYVGALYKDKHDRQTSVSVGYGSGNQVEFGLSTYWKLKLR